MLGTALQKLLLKKKRSVNNSGRANLRPSCHEQPQRGGPPVQARDDTIARRLLAQCRFRDEAERPLPPPGRADSGLVGYGTWGGALQDERQLTLTRELLRSERWRNEGAHSSVHLTLFLAWAEERLRRREGERLAGLEIGRAIQRFLPRWHGGGRRAYALFHRTRSCDFVKPPNFSI